MQSETKPPRELDLADLVCAIIFGGILLWDIFDGTPDKTSSFVFTGAMFSWCAAGLVVGWMAKDPRRAKKLTNLWGAVIAGTLITSVFFPAVLSDSGWEFVQALAALGVGLLLLVVAGIKLGKVYPKSSPGERL